MAFKQNRIDSKSVFYSNYKVNLNHSEKSLPSMNLFALIDNFIFNHCIS